MPFRPQCIEADRATWLAGQGRGKPEHSVQVGAARIGIYQSLLHPEFVLPINASEVAELLGRLPKRFLIGLDAVYLLGGANKQATSGRWWGMYGRSSIYLCPTPRAWLTARSDQYPGPAELRRVSPLRPRIRRDGQQWLAEVDLDELRAFYLYDVLLHEVGHHIDFLNNGRRPKSRRDEERFAEWFAATYGKRFR